MGKQRLEKNAFKLMVGVSLFMVICVCFMITSDIINHGEQSSYSDIILMFFSGALFIWVFGFIVYISPSLLPNNITQ